MLSSSRRRRSAACVGTSSLHEITPRACIRRDPTTQGTERECAQVDGRGANSQQGGTLLHRPARRDVAAENASKSATMPCGEARREQITENTSSASKCKRKCGRHAADGGPRPSEQKKVSRCSWRLCASARTNSTIAHTSTRTLRHHLTQGCLKEQAR